MKRYLRPLGILSGRAAREAVSAGLALPLAGGPLAYALVEVIERSGSKITREIKKPPHPPTAVAAAAPSPRWGERALFTRSLDFMITSAMTI